MVFSAISVQERALLSVWVPEGYLAARSRSSIENLDERGKLDTTCWPRRTTFSRALFSALETVPRLLPCLPPPKGHLFDFCGERWAPGPGSSSVQSVTHCRFSALCGVRRGCVATLHVRVTSACPPTGCICLVVSQSAMTVMDPRPTPEATGSRNVYVSGIPGLSSTWKTARERLSRNSVAGQWYNTDFPGNAGGISLLDLNFQEVGPSILHQKIVTGGTGNSKNQRSSETRSIGLSLLLEDARPSSSSEYRHECSLVF